MRIESTPMNLDPASRSPQGGRKIIRNPYARKVLNQDEFDRPGRSEIVELSVDLEELNPEANETKKSVNLSENTQQIRRKQRQDPTCQLAVNDQLYLQLLDAIEETMRQTDIVDKIRTVSRLIEIIVEFKHVSGSENWLLAELLDQEKWPEDNAWTYYHRFKHWLQKQALDQKVRLDFHAYSLKPFSVALLANCHVASALLHMPVNVALRIEKCVAAVTDRKTIIRSGIPRAMPVNLSTEYYRKVKEDIISANKTDHEAIPVLRRITSLLRLRP